jgi:hypothetical protein
MARKSEYSDEHYLKIIKDAGYERIEGEHINGISVHVLLCNACGMIHEKTSKQLSSNKKGCIFQPCKPKGRLSVHSILKFLEDNRIVIDEVMVLEPVDTPINRLVLSADEKLLFRKDNKIMTQTWNQSSRRYKKKGPFFQEDGTGRAKASDTLTTTFISSICEPKKLIIPSQIPVRRSDIAEYMHDTCKQPIKLRFKQLEDWTSIDCPHCYPIEETLVERFNFFLKDRQMVYKGKLNALKGKKQAEKNQKIQISCLVCFHNNSLRSYDSIRNRGFLFCDHFLCENTYDTRDKRNQSLEYYIDLLKGENIQTAAQAQQRFPNSANSYKPARYPDESGEMMRGEMYRQIRLLMGWDENEITVDFTKEEIKLAFSGASKNGATTIMELRSMIPKKMNNFITRSIAKNIYLHHEILDELNIKRNKRIRIDDLRDTIDFIDNNNLDSWSDIANNFPLVCNQIIDSSLKNRLFEHYQWQHLANYTNTDDEQLLAIAKDLVEKNNYVIVDEIENHSYGLINNIRSRGLMDRLYDITCIEKASSWLNFTYEETLKCVGEQKLISLSDFHHSHSGLYKYVSKKGWLTELAKDCLWGNYLGIDGLSYGSIPELVFANFLALNDIEYESHKRIPFVRGQRGGILYTDFYIQDKLWVEVWAYKSDAVLESSSPFANYPSQRIYKEECYRLNNLNLCSIEGGVFYGKIKVKDCNLKRGLTVFLKHACNQLSKSDINVELNENTIVAIRKSMSSESQNLNIQM